ncbi:PKD domain-containing protein [Nakamurella sp. A5-74]|uniref:PKD domain-containing protein n=1 Tax=Nakamurella sp. A5-74 TaxID=3158264 RepID=A0AAU8DL82_9ACTN
MFGTGRRVTAIVAAAALVAGSLTALLAAPVAAAPAAPVEADSSIYTTDALPTTQMDGVAWTQVIVGNTVFVGGNFANARPAGAAAGVNTTPRGNFLAYSLSTGVLNTSWAPSFNGQVRTIAVSGDGATLYVGGDFTAVDGVARSRVAAFDIATRQLKANFAPEVNNSVRAIVVNGSTVYLGGDFTKINGIWRLRLGAVAAVNGVVNGWNPQAERVVTSLLVAPGGSKMVVAGQFQYLNSTVLAEGMGAVDLSTGAALPWNDGIISYGPNDGFTDLATDGTSVFATSFQYGAPPGTSQHQFEGTVKLNSTDGSIAWMEDCHGDSYSTYATRTAVYTVSHMHDCKTVGGFPEITQATADSVHLGDRWQRAMAFTNATTGTLDTNTNTNYKNWAGTPSPSIVAFSPFLQSGTFTGQSQAAWTLTGNSQYLVMGGEFPAVNANAQQGLVRFAVPSIAPKKQGPRMSTAQSWTPTATALDGGRVKVTIPANWDRDDQTLTYQLRRAGVTTVLDQVTAGSQWWNRPTVTLIDRSGVAGAASYTVVAVDADGNSASSGAVAANVAAASSYATGVLADQASLYLRLAETSGTKVVNATGGADATISGTVTRDVAGAIVGDADKAYTFAGAQVWSAPTTIAPTNAYSLEVWVKSTSTLGGSIASFGTGTNAVSATVARVLYFDTSGRIHFGTTDGTTKSQVASTAAYGDDKFHHIVATQGPAGTTLFVDGVQVAQRADLTTGMSLSGYWRMGAENLTGWPSAPARNYLTGTFDEFATYPTALSARTVAQHAKDGGIVLAVPNTPPTAGITATASGLTASVDGSTSTDPDGTIATYSYNWGDGAAATTGSAATATHTYAAAGTYTVTLTVTDNDGATATGSTSVSVVKPNAAPVAAFTSSAAGLVASVDGSTSTDSDGTIASYTWKWGDGSADTTGAAATATHTYPATGGHTVTLIATDDKGATDTVTGTVSVQASSAEVATDTFGRTVASGWGSAELGGAWTLVGSAARFSTDGSTGKMRVAAAASGLSAYLDSVSAADVTATVDVQLDKTLIAPTLISSDVRRNATGSYRVKARIAADGSVQLSTVRVVNGAETNLKTVTAAGLTVAQTDILRLSATVNGSTVSGSVWKVGGTAPTTPQVSSVDTVVTGAGSVGLVTYLSSTATNAPIAFAFANYRVVKVG